VNNGGGGQPSYPISINFARTEMIKHIPWHKNNPLPTLTEANYINYSIISKNLDIAQHQYL
jgi:hypothetical protein